MFHIAAMSGTRRAESYAAGGTYKPAPRSFAAMHCCYSVRPCSRSYSKYGTETTAWWRMARNMSRSSVRTVLIVLVVAVPDVPPGAAPSPLTEMLLKCVGPSNSTAGDVAVGKEHVD